MVSPFLQISYADQLPGMFPEHSLFSCLFLMHRMRYQALHDKRKSFGLDALFIIAVLMMNRYHVICQSRHFLRDASELRPIAVAENMGSIIGNKLRESESSHCL